MAGPPVRGAVLHALAGVETPVPGEVRVEHQPHETGLAVGEQVVEVGLQLPDGAVRPDRGQAAVPLVEHQGAVRGAGDVPGVVQPVGEHLHRQLRDLRAAGGRGGGVGHVEGGTLALLSGGRAAARDEEGSGEDAGQEPGTGVGHPTQHPWSGADRASG